jgi:hypothetical protein
MKNRGEYAIIGGKRMTWAQALIVLGPISTEHQGSSRRSAGTPQGRNLSRPYTLGS